MQLLNKVIFAAVVLTAGQTFALTDPQPVDQGTENDLLRHGVTGLVEAAYAWGSGCVVENPQVVLSCAHVVYDAIYQQWTSGTKWYRAYNGTEIPEVAVAQSLNGYFYWRTYSSAVQATTRAGRRIDEFPLAALVPDKLYDTYFRALANEFNQDAVAYFSYNDDLGGGRFARVAKDGAARLAGRQSKWITGYPGGRYPGGDPLEYRLHETGPFSARLTPEFGKLKNYITAYDEVETGSGNSGGPVWVTDNGSEPIVAGILVSGAELKTEGYSLIGVHATSKQSWKLLQAAQNSVARTGRTETYVITGPGVIPDMGQLTRAFRVRGMPKNITEVRVDFDIIHAERQDLVIVLQTPGKKVLPVYIGADEASGADVKITDLEAPLFYGLNPNGTWRLRVIDDAPLDAGEFISARVHITSR